MAAPSQRNLSLLFIALLCLYTLAPAQTGSASVTLHGGVSETLILSLAPNAEPSAGVVRLTSSYNPDRSLTVRIYGTARTTTRITVPVRLRSNAAYRLFAAAGATGSDLSSLWVSDARATGHLVAADAVAALAVAPAFDGRRGGTQSQVLSSLLELLSGPRISLGGTADSPQNALDVTLSLTVEPGDGGGEWSVELLLRGEPNSSPT